MKSQTAKTLNLAGAAITILTVLIAVLWAFPIYWGLSAL